MKSFLFQLSIGPVQSFIAQARKAHDLFAGSALLTKLREDAMKTFEEKCTYSTIEYKIIQ